MGLPIKEKPDSELDVDLYLQLLQRAGVLIEFVELQLVGVNGPGYRYYPVAENIKIRPNSCLAYRFDTPTLFDRVVIEKQTGLKFTLGVGELVIEVEIGRAVKMRSVNNPERNSTNVEIRCLDPLSNKGFDPDIEIVTIDGIVDLYPERNEKALVQAQQYVPEIIEAINLLIPEEPQP